MALISSSTNSQFRVKLDEKLQPVLGFASRDEKIKKRSKGDRR